MGRNKNHRGRRDTTAQEPAGSWSPAPDGDRGPAAQFARSQLDRPGPATRVPLGAPPSRLAWLALLVTGTLFALWTVVLAWIAFFGSDPPPSSTWP